MLRCDGLTEPCSFVDNGIRSYLVQHLRSSRPSPSALTAAPRCPHELPAAHHRFIPAAPLTIDLARSTKPHQTTVDIEVDIHKMLFAFAENPGGKDSACIALYARFPDQGKKNPARPFASRALQVLVHHQHARYQGCRCQPPQQQGFPLFSLCTHHWQARPHVTVST